MSGGHDVAAERLAQLADGATPETDAEREAVSLMAEVRGIADPAPDAVRERVRAIASTEAPETAGWRGWLAGGDGRRRAREERYAAGMPDSAPPPDGPGGLPVDLRDALGRLTQAEREIVALRVVLGLDAAEAGRVAGMTPSAVGTALHRALGKLRAEVVRP